MDPITLEKLSADLPADLVLALRHSGLSKVASALTGVPTHSEYDIYQKIGQDLFFRRRERAAIQSGAYSLAALGVG